MSRRKRKHQTKTGKPKSPPGPASLLPDGRWLPSGESLWLCLALSLLTLLVYWNVWSFGFQVFDDGNYVSHNRWVRDGLSGESFAWAFTTFRLSNWHPLTWLSFMLDRELFGTGPWGFHATNLALHVLNVWLLYWLLVELTGCRGRSAFVAAVFAVHPLHVESVAWISERKDVLSTAFGLVAVLAYVRYARRSSPAWYFASLVAYACSLLSKQMLVTLPLLLMLLDMWPLKRWESAGNTDTTPPDGSQHGETSGLDPSRYVRRLVLEKAPYMTLALVFGIVILLAQQEGGGLSDLEQFPWDVRIMNSALAYALYLWKTVWPVDLAAYYPHPGDVISTTAAAWAGLILLTLSVGAVSLRRRAPYVLFGWFWFLIALLPVIGLLQVGSQQMADRYSYVPHIGLLVALAWGVPALLPAGRWTRSALTGAALSVVLVLSSQCRAQVEYWRDNTSMLLHTVEVTGGSRFAHHNLGIAYVRRQDYNRAIEHLRLALEFEADAWSSHYSLANSLQITGDFTAAREHYLRALDLNPDSAEAHNNLGMLKLRQNLPAQAIVHFRCALELQPALDQARENLALALAQQQPAHAN